MNSKLQKFKFLDKLLFSIKILYPNIKSMEIGGMEYGWSFRSTHVFIIGYTTI